MKSFIALVVAMGFGGAVFSEPPAHISSSPPKYKGAVKEQAAEYRWAYDEATPGQLNLYRGSVQTGSLNATSGDYYAVLGPGKWETQPSDPPIVPSAELVLQALKSKKLASGGASSLPFVQERSPTMKDTSVLIAGGQSGAGFLERVSVPTATNMNVLGARSTGGTMTDQILIYGADYCPPGKT